MRAQDEGLMDEPTNENPTNGNSAPRRPVSRRTLLAAAGGGAVLGAGLLGGGLYVSQLLGVEGDASSARAATPTPSPPAKPRGPRRYVSTAVTAPQMSVWQKEGTTPSPGLLFASPRTEGFNGIIFDDAGEPVWIEPGGLNTADLRVQQYRGQPVLTYWSGTIIVDGGFGIGAGTILDTSYRPIATVRAGNGVSTDLHEFRLTPRGTALVMAYPVLPADLRPVNGPKDGWILGARVQEVDVATTGDVLVDWDGLDDIDLTESFQKVSKKGNGSGVSPETPFDPIHLNSVEADGESALLISARHTHALYSIDRTSAILRWKLGGRASDFNVPEDAAFAWQHDARRQPDGRITLFDNHKKTGKGVSSGLSLFVDETAKTVTLDRRYTFRKHFGGAMGGTQVLPTGNVLVGWGLDPALTEFTPDGTAIFDVNLGGPSYRSYRDPWNATPAAPPDVAVRPDDDGMRVYMSWNGATGVSSWQVLSGSSAGSLAPAVTVAREGFESSVVIPSAVWVQVKALDASGAVIGVSKPHSV